MDSAKTVYVFVFSSPEPKAEVGFPDQNLSVACRRCRKLLTFPNFIQTWHKTLLGFEFVQMKNNVLFQGKIITK